jgi:hypothetical protein
MQHSDHSALVQSVCMFQPAHRHDDQQKTGFVGRIQRQRNSRVSAWHAVSCQSVVGSRCIMQLRLLHHMCAWVQDFCDGVNNAQGHATPSGRLQQSCTHQHSQQEAAAIGCVRHPSSVRLCLRPRTVGLAWLSCVWPAGGGCAPPCDLIKKQEASGADQHNEELIVLFGVPRERQQENTPHVGWSASNATCYCAYVDVGLP